MVCHPELLLAKDLRGCVVLERIVRAFQPRSSLETNKRRVSPKQFPEVLRQKRLRMTIFISTFVSIRFSSDRDRLSLHGHSSDLILFPS
jgi:hypothetical protein